MLAVVIFIVPIFADAFKQAVQDQPGESSSLPTLTQVMVDISNFLKGYWFIWVPAIIGAIIAFFQWKKTEKGRSQWDHVKLRLPMHIGDIVQKAAVARWSRTFSGAVASGVPLLESIKLTGQTSGSAPVEQAMDEVYASVKSGGTLAHPIEEAAVFPPMVGHMVSVGEESGQLEAMLTKVADFYEAEVDTKVKALTSLIEPAMIVDRRRHGRLHRDRDVPAALQPLRQDPVSGHQAAAPRSAGRIDRGPSRKGSTSGFAIRPRPPVAAPHKSRRRRRRPDLSGLVAAIRSGVQRLPVARRFAAPPFSPECRSLAAPGRKYERIALSSIEGLAKGVRPGVDEGGVKETPGPSVRKANPSRGGDAKPSGLREKLSRAGRAATGVNRLRRPRGSGTEI